jgi:hypothetical protein
MFDTWTTHHKGSVSGRPIEVQTYSEGGYRVRTTQASEVPPSVSGDESSTLIMPPVPAGAPINVDGETIDALREELKTEGFDATSIAEIVSYIPA